MYRYSKEKSKKSKYFYTILGVIIILLLLYSIYIITRFETVLSTEGYTYVELDKIILEDDRYIITLKGECSEIDIFISEQQAISINEGASQVGNPRPGTHDLMVNIMSGLDIKPIMTKVTKLSEGTYFAELTLQEWNNFLIVDTRPSDAIALAVRTNTPIYVNEKLMTKTC